MICRRLKDYNGNYNLVWFGSYGKNQDGTAKFYNENDKHDNYADEQQGLADDLIQRLSIIQTELWYAYDYGLPLFNKLTRKMEVDISVMEIINEHPDVYEIISFDSTLDKHLYHANVKVRSIFGDIDLII